MKDVGKAGNLAKSARKDPPPKPIATKFPFRALINGEPVTVWPDWIEHERGHGEVWPDYGHPLGSDEQEVDTAEDHWR